MTTTPVYPPAPARGASGLLGTVTARLRSVEAWLDAKGRYAWITAMVLGFIAFWPIGLFLVVYITMTNRWSKSAMFGTPATRSTARDWATTGSVLRPSGNTAFDAYKAETLRRLEDEQQAFEAFLERLRAAKDKSEFDAFMEDRSRGTKQVAPEGNRSET